MARRTHDPLATPLRPTDLFVLLVLDDQPRHGYGVMKAAERLSNGSVRIDIGSLYRIIARMIAVRLIEDAPNAPDPGGLDDERRRYYRITPAGRRALRAELVRLKSVVTIASERGLLDRGRSR